MFDDILITTDGSDCAEVAVGYVKDLATRYGATVHVLSVVDSRIVNNAPHQDQLKEDHAEIVEGTCDELPESALSIKRAVRVDVPHRAVLRYANDQGIDLVVMGTHGRTGVERFLIGSVTENVVRLSDVPILTIRSGDSLEVTYPYTDILVPTDGSAGAEAALGPAVDIARTYDARIHTLSVVDTMAMGIDVGSGGPIDALEESARSAVKTVEEKAMQAGVPSVETVIADGHPYQSIHSYVEDHPVDLVVMGTHGRSGIERYLLGSVTEKTVRTSPVPVMTVRQPE